MHYHALGISWNQSPREPQTIQYTPHIGPPNKSAFFFFLLPLYAKRVTPRVRSRKSVFEEADFRFEDAISRWEKVHGETHNGTCAMLGARSADCESEKRVSELCHRFASRWNCRVCETAITRVDLCWEWCETKPRETFPLLSFSAYINSPKRCNSFRWKCREFNSSVSPNEDMRYAVVLYR